MALPAHGHIIEKPEEDYHGKKGKRKHKAGGKNTLSLRERSNSQTNQGGECREAKDKICLESVQPHVSNS